MITNQQLKILIKQAVKEKGLGIPDKRIHTFCVSNVRRLTRCKHWTKSSLPILQSIKQRVDGLNFPVWTYADSDVEAFIPKLMSYWSGSNA